MLTFLAFSLLGEIWICTHYRISHSFPAYWAQGVEGSSYKAGAQTGGRRWGKKRKLHCQSNQSLEEFLTETCTSQTQGSKSKLGKVRSRTASHFTRQKAVQDRNPDFLCAADMASSAHCSPCAIISVCPAGLYFATCLQIKGYCGPAQFD